MTRVLRLLVPGILLICLVAQAQTGDTQPYPPGPPSPVGRGPFGRHPIGKADQEDQKSSRPEAAKINNAKLQRERYLELRKETAELARMANELNTAVAASNEHTLPLELAKKADQVEKLSKRVRDRIKHGY